MCIMNVELVNKWIHTLDDEEETKTHTQFKKLIFG